MKRWEGVWGLGLTSAEPAPGLFGRLNLWSD